MASLHPGFLVRRLVSAPAALRARPLISTLYAPLQCRFASEDRAPYNKGERVGKKKLSDFDISGKVFIVTGAGGNGRGLGLCMAEGLIEAGGMVHCIDIHPEPDADFTQFKEQIDPKSGGGLEYHEVDVADTGKLERVIENIAAQRKRLDGLIAAAGIQRCESALEYPADKVAEMLAVNYTGVFISARACAREMYRYKIQGGAMCLIASMSGSIANKGFISPVYNSSKAAVVQLTRNLAMEWGRKREDGSGGIRVNSLSPGHILTPMVRKNLEKGEADRTTWEENSMLGRISKPEEYKAVGLFMLSKGSSFMTGSNLIIDGGCTAW